MATASASLSTPASILARAASSNINCFATVEIPDLNELCSWFASCRVDWSLQPISCERGYD